jgi:hypothetical protein
VEDASEPDAAQVLELSREDVVEEGKRIFLRFVRFQSVNSLHVCSHYVFRSSPADKARQIFIKSNQGEGDESRLDVLEIFGTLVE